MIEGCIDCENEAILMLQYMKLVIIYNLLSKLIFKELFYGYI